MNDSFQKTFLIGRIFRFLLGFYLLYDIFPTYQSLDMNGISLRLSIAALLVIFYLLLHFLITQFTPKLNPWFGAFLAFAPVIGTYILGYGGPAATGALTFLGVTLIVAAIRADPGCEVMSIPAIFTGKHTHLTCLLFSPIDWVEKKVAVHMEMKSEK